MQKYQPKTLLVVKNRAMGDSIIGLSTLQYLRDILPNTKIIYAVPAWIKPLYDHVEIAADEVIELKMATALEWFSTWKKLKSYSFDTVFELFQSGRSQKFFTIWEKWGGPKYLSHNHHHQEGVIHDQGVIKANIQRDLDGAWTYFGSGDLPPHFMHLEPRMKVATSSKKQIVLGVVATRQTKMWPLSYYKNLIKMIQTKHPDYKIVIPLGPGDTEIKNELTSIENDQCEIILKSLSQLPSELAGSKLYIGNDTGLKHLCVALEVTTYTLFGPEPPLEWHPYNRGHHPFYYLESLDCRTKISHYCGLNTCDTMICLNQFKASDVYERVSSLLR
jgi:heptosyltransferase-2